MTWITDKIMTDQKLRELALLLRSLPYVTSITMKISLLCQHSLPWGRRNADINGRWQGKINKTRNTMTKSENPGALTLLLQYPSHVYRHHHDSLCASLALITVGSRDIDTNIRWQGKMMKIRNTMTKKWMLRFLESFGWSKEVIIWVFAWINLP